MSEYVAGKANLVRIKLQVERKIAGGQLGKSVSPCWIGHEIGFDIGIKWVWVKIHNLPYAAKLRAFHMFIKDRRKIAIFERGRTDDHQRY